MKRKYLPTLSELIDRLSIVQLKEVKIPEHKEEYAKEIQDIVHDISLILSDKGAYEAFGDNGGEVIRAIIVLAQMNGHIWENESKVRNNTGDGNLALTHGINGIRNTAKNIIQGEFGGRKDYKVDCLAADFKDWDISWEKPETLLLDSHPNLKKMPTTYCKDCYAPRINGARCTCKDSNNG